MALAGIGLARGLQIPLNTCPYSVGCKITNKKPNRQVIRRKMTKEESERCYFMI